MFCKNCGTEISETAAFCYKCGTKTQESVTDSAPAQSQMPAQPAPAPSPFKDITHSPEAVQSAEPAPIEQPVQNTEPAPAEQPVQYTEPRPAQSPSSFEPQNYPNFDSNTVEAKALESSIFTFGLMGIIFSGSVFLSLVGLILSRIGLNKSNQYTGQYGKLKGKALAGRILAKVGFILGIVLVCYIGFCFTLGIIIGLSEASF